MVLKTRTFLMRILIGAPPSLAALTYGRQRLDGNRSYQRRN